jgi:tRNA G18 (ribose-2'-O)-methylase SpoU
VSARAPIHFVTDAADARLADYRDIQERRLAEASGRFVAESELVVRKLLASGLAVDSVLLTAPRLAALEDDLLGDFPVYVAPQPVLDAIAGFHVHRGCLAIGRRPTAVALPSAARTVLVLVDLVDVDNVGALVRNAAAFGADALLLSPRCADPFYRKAIRVSMGTVFTMPLVRARRWPDELCALREQQGLTLLAAVLDEGAVPLAQVRRPERVALVMGAEGPGLDAETRRLCDLLVTIPMDARRADSLNVATAGAVFLYHLTQR